MMQGMGFAVFWGTIFPIISETVRGIKITVGPPFFNQVNVPIGLALLALTGICPLIAWRKASQRNLRRSFTIPLRAQSPPTIQEIKTSLICLCDCNMTVEACEGAMVCEAADRLTTEAQQIIDKGLDKKAVLANFVSRYGEHILSAPTKKGFNLTAWITPFVAILAAGFGIVQIIRKWSRQQEKPKPQLKKQPKTNSDAHYENILDEVLKSLD